LALRRRWLILGVVLVGSFMAVLDVFIVTQGLPSIKTTLGAGVSDLELVVSAYSLVYAVFLITGGRLGDILDRKRIFLFGMTVFTVASALAGYAPSAPFLVGARALSGPRRGLDVSSGLVDYSGHFQRVRTSPSAGAFRGYQWDRRNHRQHYWRSSHTTRPGRSRLATDLPGQRSNRHF